MICCDLHRSDHEAVCTAFKAQEERPAGYPSQDLHYRAILFPKGDDQPRFVWLKFYQSTMFKPSQSGIEALIEGPMEKYKTMRPGYEHQWLEIIGRRSVSPDPSQNNKALAKLLGWEGSGVWRGNILVIGLIQEEIESIVGVDDEVNNGNTSRVRAPVDLGTRDLACILAYFRKT
ncbi:hypothetical protein EKO04_005720 [Ascochyta lentis]|uniref:Uncharacterized protein n=1 Tax=Ascochyta lentis TaxID=205686 RepID=A0A8H7MIZ2_9PLEO|nr:hypothetical protein EKO04_005720 [Ascochyta lentis]